MLHLVRSPELGFLRDRRLLSVSGDRVVAHFPDVRTGIVAVRRLTFHENPAQWHMKRAEARLSEARTQLAHYQAQAERYLKLAATGTVSTADADKTRAELEKAKNQLGAEGQENARIRAAVTALQKARLQPGLCGQAGIRWGGGRSRDHRGR